MAKKIVKKPVKKTVRAQPAQSPGISIVEDTLEIPAFLDQRRKKPKR